MSGNHHVSGVHVIQQSLEDILILALYGEVFLRDLVGFEHGVKVRAAGGYDVSMRQVEPVLDVKHNIAEPARVLLQTQLVQDGTALRLVLRDGEGKVVVVVAI